MDIKEQLVVLSEICRQDLKIINDRNELNRLNRESEEAKKEALALSQMISELTNSKNVLLQRRRALDEKLAAEKANVRKWEVRAEKIKGEREYTALMSEIGAQKRTITGIETEISEVTEALRSDDEKMKRATGAHEEKISAATRAHEQVRELLKNKEDVLQKNEQARAALLEKIPITLKTKYARIYDKRANQGVAFLRDGICQACMRLIPPELFIRISKGEVIEQCPSCQRILVVEHMVVPPTDG